jgi:hypothetical protein
MVEQEYHVTVLQSVDSSGAEEWYCPICGRRFLLRWPPGFKKTVLEAGDETAIHTGGKGVGRIKTTQDMEVPDMNIPDTNSPEIASSDQEDRSLEPFIEWLEKNDFESLWKG